MHIYDKRRFLVFLFALMIISGGLLAWRFGWVPQIGKFFASEGGTGIDPQYIFLRKVNTPCGDCILWDGNNPENYNTAAINEIVNAVGTRGTPARRLGVGALFEPNWVDVGRTKQSLINLLNTSLANDFPVYLSLDNYNWWDARPNLWYWWEPGISAAEKAARKANVEWSDWDGATNDAHALKISWTNWGVQFRRPPGPNLLSPAYIQNSLDNLNQLLPPVIDWYNNLPADKKYLLGGVDFGNELEIGANFYYYPNGNSYIDQPPSGDPNPVNFLASTVQIGYAALKTGNIRSSGIISSDDLNEAVRRYLNVLTKYAYDAGIPRNKIFNHTGGKGSSPDWVYPASYPAFPDLRSTLMPYAHPGWSLYREKTSPQNDPLLGSVLDEVGNTQWAAPEWLTLATDYNGWLASIRDTLNYRNNRFINIANWENIRGTPYIIDAIRTALGESPACWVSAPAASTTITGNSAVLSWTGGENMAARYLQIATNSALRTDGIFQTADIANNNVTGQTGFSISNLAPGTYYWLLASDGCSPVQRRIAYGSFSIVVPTPTPSAVPGDANGDGHVNILDFNIVVSRFGQSGAAVPGDVNHDGKVNILDFGLVVSHFGQ